MSTMDLLGSAALLSLLLLPAAQNARASETNPYVAGDEENYHKSDYDGADPDGLAMVADFVFARPLGLLATIVGGVVYVAALPFEAMSHDVRTPARRLIAEPAEFTFHRPLGCFENCRHRKVTTVTTTETVVETPY